MAGSNRLVSDLDVGALFREIRQRTAAPPPPHIVAVSGTLAEQLVRELGAGAEPGSVVLGGPDSSVAVLVHILAGDPTSDDEAVVTAADRAEIPVVLVQVWPQEDAGRPFVLSPFVVECRAGEGFPVSEIASRIAASVPDPVPLASRVPVLRDSIRSASVLRAVARNVIRALSGSSGRLAMTRDQVGLLLDEDATRAGALTPERAPQIVPAVAGILALGFVMRSVARAAQRVPMLPAPAARAAVAAAGTIAAAALAKALGERQA